MRLRHCRIVHGVGKVNRLNWRKLKWRVVALTDMLLEILDESVKFMVSLLRNVVIFALQLFLQELHIV